MLTDEDLHAHLQEFLARARIPGAVAAISIGDEIAIAAAGARSATDPAPLSARARFSMGCVSKLLVSALCLDEVRHGRLALDAPLSTWLLELKDTTRGDAQHPRHLLAFATGHQELSAAEQKRGDWVAFAGANALFSPGTQFSYEHTAYVALGKLLHLVCGEDIESLLTRRFFEPLQLDSRGAAHLVSGHTYDEDNTRLVLTRSPSFRSNGAVSDKALSVRELLEIARAFLGAASVRGIVDERTVEAQRLLHSRVAAFVEGTAPIGLPIAYGLGVAHYANGLIGFDGGFAGQVCAIRWSVERRIAIAVALNIGSPNLRAALLDLIARAAGIPQNEPMPPTRSRYDFELARLTGTYRGMDRSALTVTRSDEGFAFHFQLNGAGRPLLVPVAYHSDTNSLSVTGLGRLLGIAVFLAPDGSVPCVALGLNVYRQCSSERGS